MSKYLAALNQIEQEKSTQHVRSVSAESSKKVSLGGLWKFIFPLFVIGALLASAYFFTKHQPVNPSSFFTIQLATYRTESRAKVQAQKFTTEGYETFVVPQDGFFQLCLGKFANENLAHAEWTKLKNILKDYKDRYVRFIHEKAAP